MARLPDGRFHVRSGGQDVALPPAQAAQAVGLPLADFESRMAQATQAVLAAPRPATGSPPTAPPIWQGRARHGDYAEVISRNPDGTFQVRVAGKELTRTERDVAYMTGLTKAPLYAMLAKATEGRMGANAASAGPASAGQFNARQGDRGSLVVPGGLESDPRQGFDRAAHFEKPVADLFGALQTAVDLLSGATGRQSRRPLDAGPDARNQSAPAVTFEADGTIGIAGDARLWAEGLLNDNRGDARAARDQAQATIHEELWHAAQLAGMRNDWIRAGSPGSFVDWVHDRSTEIMESIGDAAARATPAEAARIKQALFDTWSLYFAPEGHGQTPESVFRQLTSPVQRGRLVARGTFLAEFTRQLHQAGVTGQTTETAGLLGRLKAWVQQALDGLKQAYAMARGGALGQPLRDLMDRTDAVLQGRESALPIQPGLHLPSGPGDAFLAGDNGNNYLIRVRLEKPMTNTKLPIPYMYETNPSQSSHTRRDAETALRELLERAEHDARRSSRADAGERIRAEAESLVSWAGENGWLIHGGNFQRLTGTFRELEGGAEHNVFFSADHGRVIKVTRPPNFGARGNLTSYISNIQWSNQLFHDDILFEGVVMGQDGPSVVISQPFIKGKSPQEGDIISWMAIQGYISVGYNMWRHPRTEVLIADAHTGNFIFTTDGFLVPIDLQVLNPGKSQ